MPKSQKVYAGVNPRIKKQALSQEQFDKEIEKGFISMETGKTVSAKQVREEMQRRYNI